MVIHPRATCVPTSLCWWETKQREFHGQGFYGLQFPVLTQESLSLGP